MLASCLMANPTQPMFLERKSYRQRRVRDAARLLPLLGFLGICLPLLWGGAAGPFTSAGVLYLFGVWLGLIIAALILSRHLGQIDAPDASD